MSASTPLVCALNDAVCIRVSGTDAGDFLRAQLARDPPPLAAHTLPRTAAEGSVLAAWLDARGRVRALFRVSALEQDYMLLAERATAAAVLTKLRMFVLRSRVVLALDDDWQAAAVVGGADELPQAAAAAVAPPDELAQAAPIARGRELRWLPIGPRLAYVLGPRSEVAELAAGFEEADPSVIELAEVRLGLPKLGAALTERYVPQMLNLDLLGAVAFDKGCYPGQEIVARLKYRGDVKRRLRRFACAAPAAFPAPGGEIVDASGTAAGEVVRAARTDGGVELLAVVQLEAAASGLRLAAEPGMTLAPQPLPFDVPEKRV
jgi:folate-binding protein YgfZ